MAGLWKKGLRVGEPLRIFYASDFHGSDTTFKKFVNAGRFYEADVLVCGGDLMGKTVVPIVANGPGASYAYLHGRRQDFTTPTEVANFKEALGKSGAYPLDCEPDEYQIISQDPVAIEKIFNTLASVRLRRWIDIANERLEGTNTRCLLGGGNDDTDEFLEELDDLPGENLVNSEAGTFRLDDRHVLVTVGYSSPTPWNTPREKSEEEIAKAIDEVTNTLDDTAAAVFNFHVPPIDSSLDRCIKLDDSVWPPKPLMERGQPVFFGAGSQAVRTAIESMQPVVGLHGHIHESRGVVKFGASMSFNPGSEYGEGILRGLIVTIRDSKVLGYQFTSG
jgi:Icc-related predicted phosphoesterase